MTALDERAAHAHSHVQWRHPEASAKALALWMSFYDSHKEHEAWMRETGRKMRRDLLSVAVGLLVLLWELRVIITHI